MDRSSIFVARGTGRWFPADPVALRETILQMLAAATPPALAAAPDVLIAPHAGLPYSGPVAAHAYRAWQDTCTDATPPLFVVLGFSHRERFPGLCLLDGDAVRTPLGDVRLDDDARTELQNALPFARVGRDPHDGEHSAENQIPFIQSAAPSAALVVGLFGGRERATLDDTADAISQLAQRRALVLVASSDMLHDPDHVKVAETDALTRGALRRLDIDALHSLWRPDHQCLCGIAPVTTALRHATNVGAHHAYELAYSNTGETHPESRGQWVVGYTAMAYARR